MEFVFKFKAEEYRLSLSRETTLREVGLRLQKLTNTDPSTQKLLGSGIKGLLKLQENASLTIEQTGLQSGKRYTLMGSSKEAILNVQSARGLLRMRGFEDEERIEAMRRYIGPTTYKPPNHDYSFERYEVLTGEEWPSQSRAMQLLYRLANDPGIVGIMWEHRWRVGLLSEMPPEGKVGISRVCVLGYNVNKGQEISLRLRTDDKRGFRKYETIRNTLVHELAHMVYSDHDEHFKLLNSELLRECDRYLRRNRGRMLIDGPTATMPDAFEDAADGRAVGGESNHRDPAEAARQAALKRARDSS